MNKIIWFDITHPAQFNFYKEVIRVLSKNNLVFITSTERGRLKEIICDAYENSENIKYTFLCTHKSKKKINIYIYNIKRLVKLLILIFKIRPVICITNGSLGGIVSKILKIPNIQFGDDPEHKDFKLKKYFSDELYYCIPDFKSEFYSTINTPKEWSYLSPIYFTPNTKILSIYNLVKKEYIFIREVNVGTLNYRGQRKNKVVEFIRKLSINQKIVLSLEDKTQSYLYPKDWIILNEPVEDIHSLIYYSKLVISSGDSMAREGALLGVKSIYLGDRDMRANKSLIDRKLLLKADEKISDYDLLQFIGNKYDLDYQNSVREILLNEWMDVNHFIIDEVNKYIKG